jgi:hypothetical protein
VVAANQNQVTASADRRSTRLVFLAAAGLLPLRKQGEGDPLDRGEFNRRFVELSRSLNAVFRRPQADALREIERILEADWQEIPADERQRLIRDAAEAIAAVGRGKRQRVRERVNAAALRMERRVRAAARRQFNLKVRARLPQEQARRAVELALLTPEFIEGEFERRSDRTKDILTVLLAAALASNLASSEIVRRMVARMRALVERPEYFTGVAASVLNRARTHSTMTVFREAGVQIVRVQAVLDEKTCVKCRFMHGTEFPAEPVADLLDRIARARSSKTVNRVNPFLREGRNRAGDPIVYFAKPDGSRETIANIIVSGRGEAGNEGRFDNGWSATRLLAAGVGPPPYHPLCRCVLVPA